LTQLLCHGSRGTLRLGRTDGILKLDLSARQRQITNNREGERTNIKQEKIYM
jgi:hypothetical protein